MSAAHLSVLRVSRRSALGSLPLAIALAVGSSAPAQSQQIPAGFLLEAVVDTTGLVNPISFDFLPDGRILLLEHFTSSIRIAPVGSAASTGIFSVPNVSSDVFERGVLGLAVDPGWPERPYVYVSYTHIIGREYITMYTASGDLDDSSSVNVTLGSAFHLLTDIPDLYDVHNGSTLRFGPDGMLYASFGDDASACTAQDRTVLTGKIIRLDVSSMPQAGTGPPPKSDITPADNPFDGPDENERLVFAWGLRNPFRFTIDPGTGDVYIGDVGEASFEEINRRTGLLGAGCNFGWPRKEGTQITEFTCGITNILTNPIYTYPHGFLGQAVIGGPLYRADGDDPHVFPVGYQGTVFFAEFYDGWIRRLVRNGSTWSLAPPVPGQPSPSNWAEGIPRISDFQVGPDGALYLLQFTGGSRGLHRIRPINASDVPASLSATSPRLSAFPNPARVGQVVTLRGFAGESAPNPLLIVDLGGRRLRTIAGRIESDGVATYRWDGRTADGVPARPGVYYVRATGEGRDDSAAIARVVRIP